MDAVEQSQDPGGIVGVVGLGNMGWQIADRLGATGHRVLAFDTNPDVRPGPWETAESLAEVESRSRRILLVLPTVTIVQAVAEQVSADLRAEQTVINHSTVGVADTIALAEVVTAAGARFLDAPVSGGAEAAGEGLLTIFVGGAASTLEDCRDVLGAYGRQVTHCGDVGAGTAFKLVNQHLVAVHTVAASEALALAVRLGLDPQVAAARLADGAAGSTMLRVVAARIGSDYGQVKGSIDILRKDAGLVLAAAEAAGSEPVLLPMAATILEDLHKQGWGERDIASMFTRFA